MSDLLRDRFVDPVQDAEDERRKVGSIEWMVKGDQFIEDAPRRPHVALLIISEQGLSR